MAATVDQKPQGEGNGRGDSTRQHLRGSTLLLSGRLLSLALNFVPQILTVRYLSKTDYGAFALALALAVHGATLASLGMNTAAARFIPIFEERREREKILGALLVMAGSMLGMGLGIVAVVVGCRGLLSGVFDDSSPSLALLLILVLTVPVGALDHLLESLMAVFSNARAIFFRRYILAPAIKITAVLLVILTGSDVYVLAYAHLVLGVLVVAIYSVWTCRVARSRGWLGSFPLRRSSFPTRETFAFALPVLGSDATLVFRGMLVLLFLEFLHGSAAVAEYRAVLPLAELNRVVLRNFGLLFIPVAARLLIQDERRELDELYWRSAAWITLLTLPVFAACFSLARPITVLLLEERYAPSATILTVLSVGYYFNAMLGPNAAMLRVLGRVRYLLAIDGLVTVFALVACALAVPRYGALGAAFATAATVMVHNGLVQIALWRLGPIGRLQRRYLRMYALAVSGALALFLVQRAWQPPLLVGLALVAALSLVVLRLNRRLLGLDQTFPELTRLPVIRHLLGFGGR